MGALQGRVAIITGAGRGLGRAHALCFAAEGARVVVNDRGGASDGSGSDVSAAEDVVAEIVAAGGDAVASAHDVSVWSEAEELVDLAISTFGDLDVLVNNAGIVRDRAIVNMSEDEWDSVIAVHLKGHFAPLRFAAAHWRAESKAGSTKVRSVVHTSSTSGLFANPGQANYGSAKSAIATLSQIAAKELARYHVRSNCVVPVARTRLTADQPGLADIMSPRADAFDVWDPANASPLVAYLASEGCAFTGQTFYIQGGAIALVQGWERGDGIERDATWTVAELAESLGPLVTRSRAAAG
jgi:NAD(P)-dependent dehydrogenase (short-subunit alcohol dehydrogenase family)